MPEAVAFSTDVQGRGVVKQTIQERRGEGGIRKDLTPLAVALVAGEDDRLAQFIALASLLHSDPETGRLIVRSSARCGQVLPLGYSWRCLLHMLQLRSLSW